MFTTKARVKTGGIGGLFIWGNNNIQQLGLPLELAKVFVPVPTQLDTSRDWRKISAGGRYTMAIKWDGTLWGWNYNQEGRLALDLNSPGIDNTLFDLPEQIGQENDWKEVVAGSMTTLAIKKDGTLWMWGRKLGTTGENRIPVQVGEFDDWDMVSVGEGFAAAIRHGRLYTWGNGANGKLGHNNLTNYTEPKEVIGFDDWDYVSCGSDFMAAIRRGALYTWGRGYDGQLGLGISGFGTDRRIPTRVGEYSDWEKVVCAYWPFAIGLRQGLVYTWGRSLNGESGTGIGFMTSNVPMVIPDFFGGWEDISVRSNFVVGIRQGKLFSWGYNGQGQLGLGDTEDRYIPTQVGKINDWIAVSCGHDHALALRGGNR